MTELKITQVQVNPINEPKGKLRGFARICLNDQLQLTSLRIYEGTRGLFVSFPNDPSYKGDDYKQLFYPVSKEFREHIDQVVLAEYEHETTQIS